jgi:hypothetical protein
MPMAYGFWAILPTFPPPPPESGNDYTPGTPAVVEYSKCNGVSG